MAVVRTKAQVSAATATGDTTKTLIDTLTIPQNVKRIIGIWAHGLAGATITTAEAVTGIAEFESDDMSLTPLQFPLDIVSVLTSGAVALNPRVWPVSIDVAGGEKVRGYITMDMAQTGALKGRFGLIYEMKEV